MKKLQISRDLSLPLGAVTERLAFVGMSGGGKTYAAMKLAELFLEVGAQVVVLDPVGPWWGLRASATGKRPGFPIHVFGGIHGDLPLAHTAGALVADLIVEKGISAVLDVSDFTVGEMATFVSNFAERFFNRKKRSPTPIHLFLEEAHFFIPQVLPQGERGDKAGVMMNRVDRIVRVGRNYGVGCSIISQQPQSVKKTALNQSRTIFAFASGGKHERQAIIDWFGSNTRVDNDVIYELLRKLENGVAYFASTWLKEDGRQVHVAPKTTFDSSKTPQFGETLPKPKVLAPVDVAAVRDAMAEVMRSAEADDPQALRRRIVKLEREIAKRPIIAVKSEEIKRVEVPVIKKSQVKRFEASLSRAVKLEGRLRSLSLSLNSEANSIQIGAQTLEGALRFNDHPRLPEVATPPVWKGSARDLCYDRPVGDLKKHVTPSPKVDQPPASGNLTAYARGLLRTLAEREPMRLTTGHLAALSRRSTRSSAFQKALADLRREGLVTSEDGRMVLTDAGHSQAGTISRAVPTTPKELQTVWLEVLPGYERTLLKALLNVHPGDLSLEELGVRAGKSPTSSAFQAALASLKRNGLVEVHAGRVRASISLFG